MKKAFIIKQLRKAALLITAALLSVSLLTGCSSAVKALKEGNGNIVLTSGFSDTDVFTVSSASNTLHASEMETRIILDDLAREYAAILGEDIMNGTDGSAIRERIREEALSRLSRIKALCLMASDRGITLTEEEKEAADTAAQQYEQGLSEEQTAYITGNSGAENDADKENSWDIFRLFGKSTGDDDTTDAEIAYLFEQYRLSDKVYRSTISGIKTEISDDEARILTAEAILFSTEHNDGSEMSDEEKQSVYAEAEECMNRITTGDGTTFDALIAEYSDSDVNNFKICRNGQIKDSYLVNGTVSDGDTTPLAETAYTLSENEKSGIITTSRGYRIVKCISTFDRAETEANKIAIVESRKEQAYNEAYDAYAAGLDTDMNTEKWSAIALPAYTEGGEGFFAAADSVQQ